MPSARACARTCCLSACRTGSSPHPDSGGVPCATTNSGTPCEPMSKRRRGFPSELRVKRGVRIVHGDKLLEEKLGRNDLCPCGSGKRVKKCCLTTGCL